MWFVLCLIVENKTIMDRTISTDVVKRRRRKVIIRVSIGLILFSMLFILLPGWIAPVVNLNEYNIANSEKGDIEISFSTYGIVSPQYNEVLTSPIATTVLRVNFRPGDNVSLTDTIIVPDVSKEYRKYVNLEQDLTIKKNSILKSAEQAIQRKRELELGLFSDSINIGQLLSQLNKERQLFKIGGGAQEKVDLAEMNYKVAMINRDKLKQQYESFNSLSLIDRSTEQIELSILQQRTKEQSDLISQSFIRAKRAGVITSLAVQPGQQIGAGQQIATIADVSNYKIIGSVPGKYANRLNYQQRVLIYIQDSVLTGKITGIAPEIKDGTVNFTVSLSEPNHPLLRAQLKTDVRIIQSNTQDVVRLPFGDYYVENSYVDLFVFNGDMLERRKVLLGGCSFDYVEVKEGLEAGERVIISAALAKTYENYQTISFKK